MELGSYQVGEKPFPGKYDMIGQSDVMQRLYGEIGDFADSDASVLLLGESGTGKELVAKAIHKEGPRRDKRYIPLNCAAFPRDLLEGQLFGHRKGAFTGAYAHKDGILKVADGGTVLLDEIIHMDVSIQGKLLRAVEEGTFIPIGDTKEEKVDVRYVSATSKSIEELHKLMEREEFLKELFYRLNVIGINIPPLREREDDIPLLIDYFLNLYNIGSKKSKAIDPDAMNILESYRWPGNVREMMSIVNRLVLKGKNNRISYEDVTNEPEFKGPGDYDIIMRRINLLAKNQKGLHIDFASVKNDLECIRGDSARNREEVYTYFCSIKDILEGRESYTPEEFRKIMDTFGYPTIGDLAEAVKGLGDRIGDIGGRMEGVIPVVKKVPKRPKTRYKYIIRDDEDGREYHITDLEKATGIPYPTFIRIIREGRVDKDKLTIPAFISYFEETKNYKAVKALKEYRQSLSDSL